MTRYSFATLDRWVTKVEKIQTAVVRQAVGDMLADIQIVPGITRGGSRVRGTIPRDLGALANSLRSTLYGSSAMTQTGQQSHVLVAGAMSAGDVARFSWGGSVAPYAAAVHYGARGLPGTFWIDVAADGWQGYVRAAMARARAEIIG